MFEVTRTMLIIGLVAGASLELWLLMRRSMNLRVVGELLLLALLPAALFGLFGLWFAVGDDFLIVVWMWLVLFSAMAAWRFHREILPVVSEATLLVYTLLLMAALWQLSGYGSAAVWRPIVIAAAIPSALTVLFVALPARLPRWLRTLLYVWYLVMVLLLGCAQFLLSATSGGAFGWWVGPQLVTLGMVTVFFVAHIAYLVMLFPARVIGRQSPKEQIQQYFQFLADRHDGRQLRPLTTLGLVAVLGTLLAVNAILAAVPYDLVFGLAFVLAPLADKSTAIHSPPFDPFASPAPPVA